MRRSPIHQSKNRRELIASHVTGKTQFATIKLALTAANEK